MGQCLGNENTEDTKNSRSIDKQIFKDKRKMDKQVKLLMLGTGDSGKTTVARQMRVLYLNGFNEKERRMFKDFIFNNIIESVKELIKGADRFGIEIEETNKAITEEYRKIIPMMGSNEITLETAQKLSALWKSPSMQKVYERANELQVYDSTQYFLDKVVQIADTNFTPTHDDVLRVRTKSKGLLETEFSCGGFSFHLIDVGGQRSERKKWIHCFQEVEAVLFVVALNDYDRLLEEDRKTNRMQEALDLFGEVINNDWFKDTNVILFFNKKDLFEKRLKSSPVKQFFPEYEGANDYKSGVEFFRNKFFASNKNPQRAAYTHETCATDTENIKFVWSSIQQIYLNNALKDNNMF